MSANMAAKQTKQLTATTHNHNLTEEDTTPTTPITMDNNTWNEFTKEFGNNLLEERVRELYKIVEMNIVEAFFRIHLNRPFFTSTLDSSVESLSDESTATSPYITAVAALSASGIVPASKAAKPPTVKQEVVDLCSSDDDDEEPPSQAASCAITAVAALSASGIVPASKAAKPPTVKQEVVDLCSSDDGRAASRARASSLPKRERRDTDASMSSLIRFASNATSTATTALSKLICKKAGKNKRDIPDTPRVPTFLIKQEMGSINVDLKKPKQADDSEDADVDESK